MSAIATHNPLHRTIGFYEASIGKKVVMAVTGVILFGYVLGHLLGNLQIYMPDTGVPSTEPINIYAAFLHSHTVMLWAVRALLLVSVVLHITASVQLTLLKRQARPIAYVKKQDIPTSYAARTMMWSGPIIAAFVVFHVLHLTVGTVLPIEEGDVRANVIGGFQHPAVALLLHRRHGAVVHASVSRPVEHVPIRRPQPPALYAGAEALCRRLRLVRRGGQYFHSSRGAGGLADSREHMELDAKIPDGPIETLWDRHKFDLKLVNPANKRKYNVIMVGSGLAGGSAAATLGELGYNVQCFCFQDSPRRAHSHRRAGRHQRRQELSRRWRQHLPPLLRHGQGRRLPRARSQRLPPGPDQRRYHRPVRGARRALRARVRRHAR